MRHPPPPSTTLSCQVLLEAGPRVPVSAGGVDLDAWGRPTQHPAEVLSAGLLREQFRPITLAAYELLRHLYGTLPVNSAQRAARAEKLSRALQQQQDQVGGWVGGRVGWRAGVWAGGRAGRWVGG